MPIILASESSRNDARGKLRGPNEETPKQREEARKAELIVRVQLGLMSPVDYFKLMGEKYKPNP